MTPETASPSRRLDARYVLVVALGAALLAAFAILSHNRMFFRAMFRFAHQDVAFALCCVGLLTRPLVELRTYRKLLLGLSLLGCIIQTGTESLIIFGFSALVIGAARANASVLARSLGVLALWASVVLLKLSIPAAEYQNWYVMYAYWVGIPFAAVYLITERSRGNLNHFSWADDALYLLALPRFITPFFQPISPTKFLQSQRAEASVELVRGALLLGLYGAGLNYLLTRIAYIPPGSVVTPYMDWLPRALVPVSNLVFVYAANASQIFCAIALFRMLGFDLHSGFRKPFLATSPADFFRRWNTYVYEDVLSLFFFPLAGRLRQFMSDRLATIASAYLAIFLGSYCLSGVLVPFALDRNPPAAFMQGLRPVQIAGYAFYWTGIVLPLILPARAARTETPTLRRRVGQRVAFVVFLLLAGAIAHKLGAAVI